VRRLRLPLVISWYLLPVEASSSYDAMHLPHERPHRSLDVSLMVPLLRGNDATLRSVIGNLFINELSAPLRGQYGTPKSPFSPPSVPPSLSSSSKLIKHPAGRQRANRASHDAMCSHGAVFVLATIRCGAIMAATFCGRLALSCTSVRAAALIRRRSAVRGLFTRARERALPFHFVR